VKLIILLLFLILAALSVVYLISSFRNIARETITAQDVPQGTYDITKWVSDADGIAYIMRNTAVPTPVRVSKGLGKNESEGFRPSHDYLNALPGKAQAYRIIDKKSSQPIAYILASERLEIEAGFNILKRRAVLFIKDPEDSQHRRMRESVGL
jgi:hypothetical protein